MDDDQIQRCRGIANNVKTLGGTPVELALLFLIEHLDSQLAAAQKEARELRALMLKCHDVQDLHDIYSVDGYAPPVGMTDRLRDVLAQARAERDTQ